MFTAISVGTQVKPLPTVPDSNITIPDRPAGWDCIFKSIHAGFPLPQFLRYSRMDVPLCSSDNRRQGVPCTCSWHWEL